MDPGAIKDEPSAAPPPRVQMAWQEPQKDYEGRRKIIG